MRGTDAGDMRVERTAEDQCAETFAVMPVATPGNRCDLFVTALTVPLLPGGLGLPNDERNSLIMGG